MSCENADAVRDLAYAKWEQAGSPPGDGVWFWLEAERELSAVKECESKPKIEPMTNPVKSSMKAVEPAPLKVAATSKKAG